MSFLDSRHICCKGILRSQYMKYFVLSVMFSWVYDSYRFCTKIHVKVKLNQNMLYFEKKATNSIYLLLLSFESTKTNYFVTFGYSARSTITLDLCECMQMNHNKMSALKLDCRMQKIGEEKIPSRSCFIFDQILIHLVIIHLNISMKFTSILLYLYRNVTLILNFHLIFK